MSKTQRELMLASEYYNVADPELSNMQNRSGLTRKHN